MKEKAQKSLQDRLNYIHFMKSCGYETKFEEHDFFLLIGFYKEITGADVKVSNWEVSIG